MKCEAWRIVFGLLNLEPEALEGWVSKHEDGSVKYEVGSVKLGVRITKHEARSWKHEAWSMKSKHIGDPKGGHTIALLNTITGFLPDTAFALLD